MDFLRRICHHVGRSCSLSWRALSMVPQCTEQLLSSVMQFWSVWGRGSSMLASWHLSALCRVLRNDLQWFLWESHTLMVPKRAKKIPRFVTCHSRILSDLHMNFLIPWGNGNDGYPSKAAWQGRNDETISILVRGMSSEFSLYDNCGFLWDLSWCFPLRSRWLLEPQEKWCSPPMKLKGPALGTTRHLTWYRICWFLGRNLGLKLGTSLLSCRGILRNHEVELIELMRCWSQCTVLYHTVHCIIILYSYCILYTI